MLLRNCFRIWLVALFLLGPVRCLLKDVSLSHPTVLLPFHLPETHINFTISLSTGCAKWSSSRPNAVKILESDDDTTCSTSAVLSAVLKEPGRIFSVVQADVKNGRPPLVSDVEVNLIKSVSIVTTTKILYIGFPFTVFSIHAFDDNGNLFTSIEGIPFTWTVLPDSKSEYPEHTGKYVLRILKWSEVSNEPPKAISALEQKGERGSSVVISGLKIGVAFIEAKISSPVYPEVHASKVRVIVKDFLIMKPSGFVSIMVQQILEIETFNMNYNKQSKLQLPTDTYWLALNKGNSHLKLHGDISSVEGLSLGETSVCIASTIPDDDTGPCLDVLVTEPDYVMFTSQPDHDWLLEVGHQYSVQVLFYDKNDNLIHPKTLVAATKYENEFVRVDTMAENQTYFLATPLKVGQSSFNSQLQSVIGLNNQKISLAEKFKVQKTQLFKIIEPVEVTPKVLGFIWMPDTTNSFFYQLEASGGSGSYRWESDNIRVAAISKQGMLETTGTPGETSITVTDRQMPRHFDTAKVYVGLPGKIVASPYHVESQVNSDLLVPIRVFIKTEASAKDKDRNDELIEVVDCVDLPLKISFSNPQIFQFLSVVPKAEDEPYNYGCGSIWLNTTGAGFTQMTIGLLDIQSIVTLAGFSELKIKNLDDTVVLSLGASVPITTSGGLLPWELDPSKFYRNAKVSNLKVIKQLPSSENLKWVEKSVFNLACSELGESTFSVTTGNHPTAHNKHPKSASVEIKIRCASPSSVKLVPEPFIPDCPPYRNMHSEPLPVLVGEPQTFLVVAKDSSGMAFTNFSSLGNTISGCKDAAIINQKNFPHIAVTFNKVDDCQLELTISGYRKMYTFRDIYDPVSVLLSLSGKLSPKLGSHTVSIFNHPSNAKHVPMIDGSGYFNLVATAVTPISDLSVDQKNSWIAIKPIKDGREVLSITDMCFPKLPSMQLEIVVSSIGTILVRSKRIMQLNSSDILEVQVMDSNGWNIESKMFDVINLQLVTNNDKVSFTQLTASEVDEEKSKFSRFYKTVARSVGTLQLHFTAKLTSGVISSLQHDIQVFNPLTVDPSVVYMLVGQFFQIQTSGGPQPLPSLHYQLDSTKVGKVHSSGLFEALEIGSCLVHVSIIDSNDMDVLSKVTVEFHVVELTSIEVNVALPSFPSEAIIPAYVTGNGGKISPLTANLNVNYDWSVSNTDVIKLLPQHEYSGIQQGQTGNFAARLLALTNGRATVSVTVTQNGNTPKTKSIFPRNAAQSLTAQATVFVYDRLALVQPKLCCRNSIFMTTKSSMFLKSNVNFVNYRLLYQTNPKLVSIDYRGQLSSGETEGQSVLTVECSEDNGINQTMVVTVEVKAVHFIRLQTAPVFSPASNAMQESSVTSMIPQGIPLTLKASLHDDQGNEFDATDANLKVKLNRYDIGQISLDNSNNTYVFRNSAPGMSAIGVSMQSHKGVLSDYVALPVGDVLICPQPDSITVGNVFCMQSPFGGQGSWSSSSPDILKIDPQTGVAIALGSGSVEVSYVFPNSRLRTFKKLAVNSALKLELTPKQNPIVYPSGDVKFKFDIGSNVLCPDLASTETTTFNTSWLKCSAWFEAHIAHLNTQLSVKPSFSSEDGFFCQLEVLSTKPEHVQSLASVFGHVNVQATILPSQSRRAVSSKIIQQQFVPRFYVATKSVILSNQYPSAEIVVEANEQVAKDLQVTAKSASLLSVTKLVKDSTVKISIDLLPNVFAQVSETVNTEIEITCGISAYSQTVTIIIQRSKFAASDKMAKASDSEEFFSLIYFYVPIILTAVCLLFGYYITLLYKQQNKLIDISVSEAAMSHSPYRSARLNDTSFGGGDAVGFLDRTGPPGATPFPHGMRRNIGVNRSLTSTLEDSMSVPNSPWPSNRTSPGRVQLWSQTSLSPSDAGRGS